MRWLVNIRQPRQVKEKVDTLVMPANHQRNPYYQFNVMKGLGEQGINGVSFL